MNIYATNEHLLFREPRYGRVELESRNSLLWWAVRGANALWTQVETRCYVHIPEYNDLGTDECQRTGGKDETAA